MLDKSLVGKVRNDEDYGANHREIWKYLKKIVTWTRKCKNL